MKIVGLRCKVVFLLLLFFVVLLHTTSRVVLSSCSWMIIRARGTTGETGPGMRARGNHSRRDMCLFRNPERGRLGSGYSSREGYIGFKGAGTFHSASQSKEGSVGFGTSQHPIFMKLLPDHLWH